MKHRKKYLVTYFFEKKDHKNGHGHAYYTVSGHGKCLIKLEKVIKEIIEANDFKNAVVTNVNEVHL